MRLPIPPPPQGNTITPSKSEIKTRDNQLIWYNFGMANKKPTSKKPPKTKPGPKQEVLKIEGDWQAAVAKSLTKKKPPGGWPK
ncbi:MAG: hypothetical protein M3O30_12905 [Planctomycetota bacterium]|nr:hypothetical protein [Planctomycetota bacterium]